MYDFLLEDEADLNNVELAKKVLNIAKENEKKLLNRDVDSYKFVRVNNYTYLFKKS